MARTRRFVGRDDELEVAARALETGVSGTVCLAGPAGIGKTTLAEELMARATEAGRTVAWSRCWDDSSTPALWPWLQVLDALDPTRGHPLRTTPTGDDRFALFDGIAEWLRDRGRSGPITLVVDDVHWADIASVELLHFLSRDVNNHDLHLLATYREEGRPPAVENRLADIEREATVLRLRGFALAELRALVDERGTRSDATVEMLHTRSEGNPFFALELARLVDQAGDADPENLPVTHGVRSVIERHLAGVSRPTRDALALAAFQGRLFDLRVIAVARQLDPLEITEMLREAERAGLTRSTGDGSWQFEHALIAETLLADLGPHERSQGHLATADGLEKVHNSDIDEHVEAIANHLLHAGSLVPPGRLLDASRAAARHAGGRLAWEDQSHHLASAVHALRSMSEPDETLLVRTLTERMGVEKRMRNLERAHDLGIEAAAIARRTNDVPGLAEVAIAFPPDSEGIEIDDIFDPDQRPLREEALAALGPDDVALRCRLEASLALSLYWETPTGSRAESHARSARRRDDLTAAALATARGLDDPAILAHALNARIHATWGPENRARRPALAEELIAVALELGDHDLALRGRGGGWPTCWSGASWPPRTARSMPSNGRPAGSAVGSTSGRSPVGGRIGRSWKVRSTTPRRSPPTRSNSARP
ncbi:MAG: AAA family ATPase [Acidimicrobiales bacterium]|nr:AAA family ATPase [Acidimicrobiales bacterium]